MKSFISTCFLFYTCLSSFARSNNTTSVFDFALCIDASGSISASEFDYAQNFAEDLVTEYFESTDVGLSDWQSRIAIAQFSDRLVIEQEFDESFDIEYTVDTIRYIRQLGGLTNIGQCISSIVNLRGQRSFAQKLLIVLTDGQSNTGNTQAAVIEAAEWTRIAIPVGDNVNASEINLIGGVVENIIAVDNYEELARPTQQSPDGPPGRNGEDGAPGRDGAPGGRDGEDGVPGRDIVGEVTDRIDQIADGKKL